MQFQVIMGRYQHQPGTQFRSGDHLRGCAGWWIYGIGPLTGMFLAVLACSFLARRIEVAKLYYFDIDRNRLFHRMTALGISGEATD
jgi:hypothetical protein